MIQLLFTVIFAEMASITMLLFTTPLREPMILGLDQVKRGRGPVMVKTIAGTVSMVLISTLYSITKIQKRSIKDGAVNLTDQILMAKHLLEASLMGFSLFLSLMIDQLHNYMREFHLLTKSMETITKQNQVIEERKRVWAKTLEEESSRWKVKVNKLESVCKTKAKEVEAREAHVMALKKQSEKLLLEYDRLLEDNQSFRDQLQSINLMLSHSNGKKSPQGIHNTTLDSFHFTS